MCTFVINPLFIALSRSLVSTRCSARPALDLTLQRSVTTKSAPAQFSFNVKDVPLFLQETDFFRSLDKDEEAITLDQSVCKFDTVIDSTNEARRCLSTMRFWGVSKPPVELAKFVLTNPGKEMADLLAEFSDELKQVKWLGKVCRRRLHTKTVRTFDDQGGFIKAISLICDHSGKAWGSEVCALAASHRWLKGLTFLHENGFPWDATTCAAAAKANSLPCLIYAREHGCPWDVRTVSYAIISGSNACLLYAVDGGCPRPLRYAKIMPHFQVGMPWGNFKCDELARAGNLAALMFARANGCEWNCRVIIDACMFGHVDCLLYALQNGCPGKELACLAIAGWVPLLSSARRNLRSWELVCTVNSMERSADEDGESLRGVVDENNLKRVCSTDADTRLWGVSPAIDRVSMLRLVLQHGCPWHKSTLAVAAKCGHLDIFQYVLDNHHPSQEEVCVAAARNWSTLQYVAFRGHALLPCAYEGAAQSDEPLMAVKFLHARDCPWDASACAAFAKFKRMNCLLFARANGAPWDASTAAGAAALCPVREELSIDYFYAAKPQALEFLRFVHESGCPWDAATCVQAVDDGNLECLKYARDHGCPWDATTCVQAVRNGDLKCLQYAREHGCPWDYTLWYWALSTKYRGDRQACIDYMHLHKCPTVGDKLKQVMLVVSAVNVPWTAHDIIKNWLV